MILGISGTNASGKDSLAEFLREEYQFMFFHTSNYIREEAMKRYGDIKRPTLFKVGNELRNEGGAGVLAEMGIEAFKQNSGKFEAVVISSIRTLGEVEAIHRANGKIIFTDASRKIRYERLKNRGRVDDDIDYQTFVKHEEAELHESDDPAKFNILGVKEKADFVIMNEKSVSELHKKAVDVLGL